MMTHPQQIQRTLTAKLLMVTSLFLTTLAAPVLGQDLLPQAVFAAAPNAPEPQPAPEPVPEEPDWPDVSPYHWQDPDDPDLTLTLTAEMMAVAENVHYWLTQAVDTATGDLVAEVSAEVTYGDVETTWLVISERFDNRFGFPPLEQLETVESFATEYNEDGSIEYAGVGDLTWLSAFLGANALDPLVAGGGWTSNGCNKPCSQKWRKCCDAHDACYCAGGTAADRKKCDDKFRACLRAAGMGRIKAGIYYRAVRIFGGRYFNFH